MCDCENKCADCKCTFPDPKNLFADFKSVLRAIEEERNPDHVLLLLPYPPYVEKGDLTRLFRSLHRRMRAVLNSPHILKDLPASFAQEVNPLLEASENL